MNTKQATAEELAEQYANGKAPVNDIGWAVAFNAFLSGYAKATESLRAENEKYRAALDIAYKKLEELRDLHVPWHKELDYRKAASAVLREIDGALKDEK